MKNTRSKVLFFIFFTLTCVNELLGQDLNFLANSLSEKYEDEEYALLDSHEKIEFKVNTKTGVLEIIETTENSFIALQDDKWYLFAQFYDENSSIEDIILRDNEDKKLKPFISDEYYHSDDYFHTDVRLKYFRTSVDKGKKFTVKTVKHYTDAKYYTRSHFYSKLPIVEKKIEYYIPTGVDIDLLPYNFDEFDIINEQVENKNYHGSIYSYEIKNVAPYSQERNSQGASHYLPHLLVIPKSYKQGLNTIYIFNETKDLYDWYRSLVLMMENDPGELAPIVEKLTSESATPEDEIKSIYYWVQDNIRYIAFEDGIAGFKPDECQNVYQKKYGDCKGMANLLKEMLLIAGYDARLTWIGTDYLPYDYSTPCLAVDNHMICTVFLDEEKYFLDATEKFNSLGTEASRIQGKQVLIENGDSFILDQIPIPPININEDIIVWDVEISDNKLIGTGQDTYTGESCIDILRGFHWIQSNEREEAILEMINKRDKNFIIRDMSHSDPKQRDDYFVIDYEFELNNLVFSYGEEIYIEIDKYKEFLGSKFEDRESDYLFDYIYDLKTTINLKIPDGYHLASFPKDFNIDNDHYSISITTKEIDGVIEYYKVFSIKQRLLPKEQFDNWNDSMDQLKIYYQEQITLSKTKP